MPVGGKKHDQPDKGQSDERVESYHHQIECGHAILLPARVTADRESFLIKSSLDQHLRVGAA
jgi:hypothetical protein